MESNQTEPMREGKICKMRIDLGNSVTPSSVITFVLWESQKKREKEAENLFEEIIVENVLNMGKEIDIQIQEAQRCPNKINPRRSTPRHTIKMAKSSENFKSSQGKNNYLRTRETS